MCDDDDVSITATTCLLFVSFQRARWMATSDARDDDSSFFVIAVCFLRFHSAFKSRGRVLSVVNNY